MTNKEIKTSFCIIFIPIIYSCTKDQIDAPEFTEATYKIEITGRWKSPAFVVPAGVHFTTFVGMVHNSNTYLWKTGSLSSLGVENVAESGNTTALFSEIDAGIAQKNAIASFFITAPSAEGVSTRNIYSNSNYSLISFESMIAPSPDWFIGLSSFNLFNNDRWISDTLVNLYVYDAGTEDGDIFGSSNPSTSPQQNIELLTPAKATVLANGNALLAAIATVRITKQ